jgi:hypothetical protein
MHRLKRLGNARRSGCLADLPVSLNMDVFQGDCAVTKIQLKRLEEKIERVMKYLDKLSNRKELKEILSIVHRPGWTSNAEGTLVNAILDSMARHANALTKLKKSLHAGCRAVAAK